MAPQSRLRQEGLRTPGPQDQLDVFRARDRVRKLGSNPGYGPGCGRAHRAGGRAWDRESEGRGGRGGDVVWESFGRRLYE